MSWAYRGDGGVGGGMSWAYRGDGGVGGGMCWAYRGDGGGAEGGRFWSYRGDGGAGWEGSGPIMTFSNKNLTANLQPWTVVLRIDSVGSLDIFDCPSVHSACTPVPALSSGMFLCIGSSQMAFCGPQTLSSLCMCIALCESSPPPHPGHLPLTLTGCHGFPHTYIFPSSPKPRAFRGTPL